MATWAERVATLEALERLVAVSPAAAHEGSRAGAARISPAAAAMAAAAGDNGN